MLIETNKTRYTTKLKLTPSSIDKINKNNLLKEFSNINIRNDSNSIKFKTIIFQKTSSDRQKDNNINSHTSKFKNNDIGQSHRTNDDLNRDIEHYKNNSKFNFTPLRMKKNSELVERDEKKLEIENIFTKNNRCNPKRDKKNQSGSVILKFNNRNEYKDNKNIFIIKNKISTSSSLIDDNNSVKILPKKHKKSFSAVINRIGSLITPREEKNLVKKLPNLNPPIKKTSHSLNKTNVTKLHLNVLDLKRQLYNKYFSISQIIKEKRISAEKDKKELKLKIVNYSDNINDQINMNKKKFLPTYYVKSLIENGHKNFPALLAKMHK